MGMFDGLLGQLGEHVDIGNLAAKLGLDPQQVEQAIAALAKSHGEPTDTIAGAADTTGLAPDTLQEIVAQVGGEGALGRFAQMLGDGQGGGLMDKLGGMFGKS